MDGSNASFLLNSTDFSSVVGPAGGILYVEDFDLEADHIVDQGGEEVTVGPAGSALTLADIEAAHDEGRLAGHRAALDDAHLLQTQIQAAATQSLADALGAAQSMLNKITRQTAEDGARLVLAMIKAAVPALIEQHGAGETEAVVRALLSGLSLEPELRIRVHPTAADRLRDLVVSVLPHGTAILSVTADEVLAPGDVQIVWRDGGAVRNTGDIWAAIQDALAPLNLPTVEELCRGFGC